MSFTQSMKNIRAMHIVPTAQWPGPSSAMAETEFSVQNRDTNAVFQSLRTAG